jgi:hypothetical protein
MCHHISAITLTSKTEDPRCHIGLMADWQITTIVRGIMALAGLLINSFLRKPTAAPATVESNSRLCPMCAEPLTNCFAQMGSKPAKRGLFYACEKWSTSIFN